MPSKALYNLSVRSFIRSSSAFLGLSTLFTLWRIFFFFEKQTLESAASTQTLWTEIRLNVLRAQIRVLFTFFWVVVQCNELNTYTHKQTKEWKNEAQHGPLWLCDIISYESLRAAYWQRIKSSMDAMTAAAASAAAAQCGSTVSLVGKHFNRTENPNPCVVSLWLSSCRHCCRCRFATLNTPGQHFVAFQFSNSVSVRYYSSLCECTDAHVQTPYCHPKQPQEEKKKKKTHSCSFEIVLI